MTKILFLNLPAAEQITRRYMCSYPSPESLMPPLELISCAAVVRELNDVDVRLLDCIAEKKMLKDAKKEISEYKPDFILSLSGFECIEQDIDSVKSIKDSFLDTCYIWFGHYASVFAKDILIHSNAQFVVLGEPESIFHELIKMLISGGDISTISGIAFLKDGDFIKNSEGVRIKNPNELPIPAYDLVGNIDNYYEPLLSKPYATIQTMRGCPYSCSYCVKSYGSRLTQLSTERIIEEIKFLQQTHNIKAIRFIDDTFTINKLRVINICEQIVEQNINIQWVCLSRTDTLDEEMIKHMKKAGCKRIYFGVESGSQRFLDILGKGVNVKEAIQTLLLCRKAGIETAGFFLSGHPEETAEDNALSIQFAIEAKLNFIAINPIQAYPGTPYYEQVKDNIDFSFYPYKNEWKKGLKDPQFDVYKNRLYAGFYWRWSFVKNNAVLLLTNMHKMVPMTIDFFRYMLWDKKFVIGGIKGKQDI